MCCAQAHWHSAGAEPLRVGVAAVRREEAPFGCLGEVGGVGGRLGGGGDRPLGRESFREDSVLGREKAR